MDPIWGTLAAAVGVFAGTNVDDLVVLTVFFVSARVNGVPRPWQVWTGQYLGIGALVAVSGAAALGLASVPEDWVGLLGVVPLALGVRGFVTTLRSRADRDEPRAPVVGGLLPVAGVTIANGADNISVYTPLFRTLGSTGGAVTAAVFAVLVAVWCVAASWLASHRRVVSAVRRYGRWLVPAVFVLIGLVIIVESGVVGRLLR